jgi:hypothetical protein
MRQVNSMERGFAPPLDRATAARACSRGVRREAKRDAAFRRLSRSTECKWRRASLAAHSMNGGGFLTPLELLTGIVA